MDDLGDIAKRTGVAFHQQLYSLLVRALGEGVIAAGSALPTESELMQRFSVSRNTVRRALGRLEDEKRIIRRRGSGSYARNNPEAPFSPDVIAEVLQRKDVARSQTKVHVVRMAVTTTPEYIRRTDPAFGEQCTVIQRWRSFKGQPFLFSVSHVPERVGGKLTRKQVAERGVLLALDAAGVKAAAAEQTTTAVLADSLTAKYLRTEIAAPLLSVQRLVRDEEDRPIEHQNHIFRPDRYNLRAQVLLKKTGDDARWLEAGAEPAAALWL